MKNIALQKSLDSIPRELRQHPQVTTCETVSQSYIEDASLFKTRMNKALETLPEGMVLQRKPEDGVGATLHISFLL